jgi:hypothetical protein
MGWILWCTVATHNLLVSLITVTQYSSWQCDYHSASHMPCIEEIWRLSMVFIAAHHGSLCGATWFHSELSNIISFSMQHSITHFMYILLWVNKSSGLEVSAMCFQIFYFIMVNALTVCFKFTEWIGSLSLNMLLMFSHINTILCIRWPQYKCSSITLQIITYLFKISDCMPSM